MYTYSEAVKRDIAEVDTPSSDSRRPRREVKRPKRYNSPDREIETPPKPQNTKPAKADPTSVRVVRMLEPTKADENGGVLVKQVEKTIINIVEKVKASINEHESIQMDIDAESKELDDEYDDEDMEDDDVEGDEMNAQSNTTEALDVLLHSGLPELEVVKSDDGFSCSVCESNFRTVKQCEQHVTKKQCFEPCGKCGKMFKKSDTDDFNNHMSSHEAGEEFACDSCKKVFYEKASLDIHTLSHCDEKNVKCSDCNEKFHTSFQQAAHLLQTHNKSLAFTCDVCKAKFVNISFMKAQLLFDGEMSYFKCVMCAN